MARLSKDEHDTILKQLADENNASPEMMDLIGRLRSDFDESLSVDMSETVRDWENRYNTVVGERDEARRLYRERFFSNALEEAEKIVDRQKNESPRGVDELLGIKKEVL